MPKSNRSVHVNERAIDEKLSWLNRSDAPGVSIGISVAGKPAYRRGFGLASMELPIVLCPHIRMRIYSVTKHFACLAYLLLCEEGKARLDDCIGKYLPQLHRVFRDVKIMHLMSNTSGIPDVSDIRWHLSGTTGDAPLSALLEMYEQLDAVNFTPGTAWCYNNGGFQLLTAAIEKAADESLEDVLRTRIFERAGLYDTFLRRVDSDFAPNSATMHMTATQSGYDRSYLPGELTGEGGLMSSVDDMLRWMAFIDKPTFGEPGTWSLLKTPQSLSNGGATGYGLGLFVGKFRGVEVISHSGSGLGGSAEMIKLPELGVDLIVLSNTHEVFAWELASEILALCIDGEGVAKAERLGYSRGTFLSPSSGRVLRLYQEDGKQKLSINGGWGYHLEADEDGVLRPAPSLAGYSYSARVVGERDTPAAIQFEEFGRSEHFEAVTPNRNSEATQIAGSYREPTSGTRIAIAAEGGGVRMRCEGRFGSAIYGLESIGANLWQFKPYMSRAYWGGVLACQKDREAFRLLTERTWTLRFQKEA